MIEQFKWVDFYEEFASKLLEYKNNRKELIGKLVKVYDSIGIKLPKLEANGIPEDIDSITAVIPRDFDGILVLNNMMASRFLLIRSRTFRQNLQVWHYLAPLPTAFLY